VIRCGRAEGTAEISLRIRAQSIDEREMLGKGKSKAAPGPAKCAPVTSSHGQSACDIESQARERVGEDDSRLAVGCSWFLVRCSWLLSDAGISRHQISVLAGRKLREHRRHTFTSGPRGREGRRGQRCSLQTATKNPKPWPAPRGCRDKATVPFVYKQRAPSLPNAPSGTNSRLEVKRLKSQ
jgi:hypothetical protein